MSQPANNLAKPVYKPHQLLAQLASMVPPSPGQPAHQMSTATLMHLAMSVLQDTSLQLVYVYLAIPLMLIVNNAVQIILNCVMHAKLVTILTQMPTPVNNVIQAV